ncbi:hypothetical protein Tco_0691928 [Tanacetum coccineum]
MQAHIYSIKGMVTELFQAFKGISSLTPSVTPKPDREKGIARDTDESPRKLMPASKEVRQDTDTPVVQEEATKDRVDPKILARKKGVCRGTDKRNFDVHKPFRFTDFGITKWDELREIIPRKKNKVVEDLMNSLSKKYEKLRATTEELGIRSSLPEPRKVLSLTSGRKRKAQDMEPEVHIPRLESFQRMSDIHKVDVDTLLSYLVMDSNFNTPANTRFCLVLRSLIKSHPDKEMLNVGIKSLLDVV